MSVLSETLNDLLRQSVPKEPKEDPFVPPRILKDEEIVDIPNLKSKGEVAEAVVDMKNEIELIEFRAGANAVAERLEWLRKANSTPRCSHVLSSGYTCGCPALKGQEYCRFHGQAHTPEIELPVIEDIDSLQLAYMSIAQQIVSKKLDAARAKVLLQTVECAARNLEHYPQDDEE